VKIAPIVVACIVTAVAAEVGLRLVQRARYGTSVWTLLPGYRDRVFQRSPFLVFGPRVNWRFDGSGDPTWRVFNEMGIRLPGPVPPREAGEVRVLAIGGSTTEDATNTEGIHWPLALECILRNQGRTDVRILNAGMSAYTTAHSLVRYQFDLVETDPDVVLIMHNINDLTVLYYAAATLAPVDPNYLVKYGRPEYTGYVDDSDVVLSRVFFAIRNRLWPPATDLLPYPEWREYEIGELSPIFERNLRTLVRAVTASGASVVLMTMPRTGDPAVVDYTRLLVNSPGVSLLPAADRFFEDFDGMNEVIREVAASEGVTLVDMATSFISLSDQSGRGNLFLDVVHYSAEGSRTFASTLARFADRWLPPFTGGRIDEATLVSCEHAL
jgi:hypothetical protein